MSDGVVGVYEMLWDCAFCDTRALLGKTNRFCPGCGAPQDPKKRYFPPAGKEVAANTTYDGVDVSCPACQTPNGALAKCCKHCGSPLNEAGRVALVARQGQPAPAVAAVATKSSKLPWVLGAGALVVVAGISAALTWKKEVKATVDGHSWERVIEIEQKRAVSESAWCDATPADAYGLSRKKEQRSTRQVADGETCHTENHDRGDGTFEKRQVCAPKTRSEPVYDDKCSFTVDRWKSGRSVRETGGLGDAPKWPAFTLARTGESLGSEREGARHETYSVTLTGADQKPYRCDVDPARWRALTEGQSYALKVRMMTGGADCDSLGAR